MLQIGIPVLLLIIRDSHTLCEPKRSWQGGGVRAAAAGSSWGAEVLLHKSRSPELDVNV